MIIHQWVPAAHRGDAVGDSARRVRALLRGMGHASEIFALTIDDDLAGDVRPFADPEARRGDVTIFHYALPSPMTAAFRTLPGGRVLQYHNVTPAGFFAPFDPHICRLAGLGRQELRTLVGHVDLALGVSDYNRRELERLGFAPTAVVPLALDLDRLRSAPRRPALEAVLAEEGWSNFLFVGRVAPNKKIEDYIRLAEVYKRYVDEEYRFVFVGKHDAVPKYYAAVCGLMAEFRMPPGRFWFTGPVPEEDLATFYRMARVYVSLSEHEGFGAPLVEAMAHDVPVMAYDAAAVPETLGGAGVLFAPKDMEFAAELLGELAYDEDLRARVVAGQRQRLAAFTGDHQAERLRWLVGEFE